MCHVSENASDMTILWQHGAGHIFLHWAMDDDLSGVDAGKYIRRAWYGFGSLATWKSVSLRVLTRGKSRFETLSNNCHTILIIFDI